MDVDRMKVDVLSLTLLLFQRNNVMIIVVIIIFDGKHAERSSLLPESAWHISCKQPSLHSHAMDGWKKALFTAFSCFSPVILRYTTKMPIRSILIHSLQKLGIADEKNGQSRLRTALFYTALPCDTVQ